MSFFSGEGAKRRKRRKEGINDNCRWKIEIFTSTHKNAKYLFVFTFLFIIWQIPCISANLLALSPFRFSLLACLCCQPYVVLGEQKNPFCSSPSFALSQASLRFEEEENLSLPLFSPPPCYLALWEKCGRCQSAPPSLPLFNTSLASKVV